MTTVILYLPAALACVLTLVAIDGSRVPTVPKTVRGVQLAQFCVPQDTLDAHRLYCRQAGG